MGIGPLARWKHNDPAELVRHLWLALAVSLAVGAFTSYATEVSGRWLVVLGATLVTWLLLTHLVSLRERYRHKGFAAAFADLGGKGRSYYGMWLAHLGVGMFIVGATMVSNFGVEKDIRMSPGDRYEVAGYSFVFEGVGTFQGPNYRADRGHFRVFQGEREVAFLEPEKRTYLVQNRPMTEAAIDPSLTRDLYVSLGEPVGGEGDWSLRIYYKPFVRWIWLGAIFMGLGGLVAVSDRRYRPLKRTREQELGRRAAATT
jgi:cytochrome c-type biogenesis protein CcmF